MKLDEQPNKGSKRFRLGITTGFSTDSVGRKYFQPWLPFGKAYYIDTQEQELAIHNIRATILVIIGVIAFLKIFLGPNNFKWYFDYLLIPPIILIYDIWIKRIIKKMDVVNEKIENPFFKIPKDQRVLLVVIVLCALIGSLGNLITHEFVPEDLFTALLAIAFLVWIIACHLNKN